MVSPRVRKVQKLLAREISRILSCEIKDPRIAGITIVDVEAASDLKRAVVYYRLLSEDGQARKEALEGLKSATGAVKRMLGARVRLKFTPALVFKYDKTYEKARRIEELLEQERQKELSWENER